METLEPHLFNRILFETISISLVNSYSNQIMTYKLVSPQWRDLVDNNILFKKLIYEMDETNITALFYDSILLGDWMLVITLVNECVDKIDWELKEQGYVLISCIDSTIKYFYKGSRWVLSFVEKGEEIFAQTESHYNAFCRLSGVHNTMPYSLFIKCINIISKISIESITSIIDVINSDYQYEDKIIYKYICYLAFDFLPIISIDFDRLSILNLCSINIRKEYKKDALTYLKSEYDFLKEIQGNNEMIGLLDDKYMDDSGKIDENIYELILSTLSKWQ